MRNFFLTIALLFTSMAFGASVDLNVTIDNNDCNITTIRFYAIDANGESNVTIVENNSSNPFNGVVTLDDTFLYIVSVERNETGVLQEYFARSYNDNNISLLADSFDLETSSFLPSFTTDLILDCNNVVFQTTLPYPPKSFLRFSGSNLSVEKEVALTDANFTTYTLFQFPYSIDATLLYVEDNGSISYLDRNSTTGLYENKQTDSDINVTNFYLLPEDNRLFASNVFDNTLYEVFQEGPLFYTFLRPTNYPLVKVMKQSLNTLFITQKDIEITNTKELWVDVNLSSYTIFDAVSTMDPNYIFVAHDDNISVLNMKNPYNVFVEDTIFSLNDATQEIRKIVPMQNENYFALLIRDTNSDTTNLTLVDNNGSLFFQTLSDENVSDFFITPNEDFIVYTAESNGSYYERRFVFSTTLVQENIIDPIVTPYSYSYNNFDIRLSYLEGNTLYMASYTPYKFLAQYDGLYEQEYILEPVYGDIALNILKQTPLGYSFDTLSITNLNGDFNSSVNIYWGDLIQIPETNLFETTLIVDASTSSEEFLAQNSIVIQTSSYPFNAYISSTPDSNVTLISFVADDGSITQYDINASIFSLDTAKRYSIEINENNETWVYNQYDRKFYLKETPLGATDINGTQGLDLYSLFGDDGIYIDISASSRVAYQPSLKQQYIPQAYSDRWGIPEINNILSYSQINGNTLYTMLPQGNGSIAIVPQHPYGSYIDITYTIDYPFLVDMFTTLDPDITHVTQVDGTLAYFIDLVLKDSFEEGIVSVTINLTDDLNNTVSYKYLLDFYPFKPFYIGQNETPAIGSTVTFSLENMVTLTDTNISFESISWKMGDYSIENNDTNFSVLFSYPGMYDLESNVTYTSRDSNGTIYEANKTVIIPTKITVANPDLNFTLQQGFNYLSLPSYSYLSLEDLKDLFFRQSDIAYIIQYKDDTWLYFDGRPYSDGVTANSFENSMASIRSGEGFIVYAYNDVNISLPIYEPDNSGHENDFITISKDGWYLVGVNSDMDMTTLENIIADQGYDLKYLQLIKGGSYFYYTKYSDIESSLIELGQTSISQISRNDGFWIYVEKK